VGVERRSTLRRANEERQVQANWWRLFKRASLQECRLDYSNGKKSVSKRIPTGKPQNNGAHSLGRSFVSLGLCRDNLRHFDEKKSSRDL
jgi:hypothetical protein